MYNFADLEKKMHLLEHLLLLSAQLGRQGAITPHNQQSKNKDLWKNKDMVLKIKNFKPA
jgi:hypothetical protein